MVEMYYKNLPLSKDLDSQESMHGKELLSLACNALILECWLLCSVNHVIGVWLEFPKVGIELESRVHNYTIKRMITWLEKFQVEKVESCGSPKLIGFFVFFFGGY